MLVLSVARECECICVSMVRPTWESPRREHMAKVSVEFFKYNRSGTAVPKVVIGLFASWHYLLIFTFADCYNRKVHSGTLYTLLNLFY